MGAAAAREILAAIRDNPSRAVSAGGSASAEPPNHDRKDSDRSQEDDVASARPVVHCAEPSARDGITEGIQVSEKLLADLADTLDSPWTKHRILQLAASSDDIADGTHRQPRDQTGSDLASVFR